MIFENVNDFIEKFKNEYIAIHCPKEDDAKHFLNFLSDMRIYWNSGNVIDDETHYNEYKEKTCYIYLNNGIVYATDEFYKNRDNIVIKFSHIKDFIVGDNMRLYTLTENGIVERDIMTKIVEVPVNDTVEKYHMKLDESVVEIDINELKEFILSKKKKENKVAIIESFDIKKGLITFSLYAGDEYVDVEVYKLRESELEVIKTLLVAEILAAMNEGIKVPTEMHESMHILEYIVYKLFGDGKND